MSKSNLTIKIDDDLIRAVRVLAAEKNSSISALVSTYIENLVRNEAEYQAAKERALARMKKGWDLGWKPVSREELHER
jgi:predicted transcriptional regulator